MTKPSHTPTPWTKSTDSRWIGGNHKGAGFVQEICMLHDHHGKGAANAAFIVRAVNSHEALIAALEGLFEHCAMMHKHWGEGCNQREADEAITKARAALSLAREG